MKCFVVYHCIYIFDIGTCTDPVYKDYMTTSYIYYKDYNKMSWVNAVSKPAQGGKAKASTLHHTATSHIHEVFGLPCSASLLLQQKVGMPYSKAAMDPVSKSKVLATKQIGLHHAKFIVPTRTVV